jgi:hypothetical protein
MPRKAIFLALFFWVRTHLLGRSLPLLFAFPFPYLLFCKDTRKDSTKIARPFCPQSARLLVIRSQRRRAKGKQRAKFGHRRAVGEACRIPPC